MSMRRAHHHREAGFTLIELMVVLVILGIVGTVITASLTRGVQASNQAQARIEAYEDMQIALERVSRDVRGASTPLLAIDGTDWDVGEGIALQRLLDGDGACVRHTYWVADGSLHAAEERSTDGCVTFASSGERILVPQLDNSTVFSFSTYDENGKRKPITDADDISDISVVTITFTRTLVGQQNATVETNVGLRNAQ